MTVLQFRGPITYCVLQWCHPMPTGTQRRTGCSTRMITLYGDQVIKLDSGPRTMRKFFFSLIFSFSSGQGKVLILQYIWLYIIISSSREIRPTLRLSYISVYIKS